MARQRSYDSTQRDPAVLNALLECVAGWEQPAPQLVSEAAAGLAMAGVPPSPRSIKGARILFDLLVEGPSRFATLSADLGPWCEAIIRPGWAAAFADHLHGLSALPAWNRLPRLLVGDPLRLDRLLDDTVKLVGRQRQWAQIVTEATAGCLDAGGPIPEHLAAELARLTGLTQAADDAASSGLVVESYQARLRLLARQDARGALALLREVSGEVGADPISAGTTAVLSRLAGTDWAALVRYLEEETDRFAEKVAAFNLALLTTAGAEARGVAQRLVADLEQNVDELYPRDAWTSTFDLLAVAARLGDVDLALRIVHAAGPSAALVLEATGFASRVRLCAGDDEAGRFIESLLPALQEQGEGPASVHRGRWLDWHGLPRALWEARWCLYVTRAEEIPWWTPRGPALP